MKKITVVGNGIMGTAVAYALDEAGYEVQVIHSGDINKCASLCATGLFRDSWYSKLPYYQDSIDFWNRHGVEIVDTTSDMYTKKGAWIKTSKANCKIVKDLSKLTIEGSCRNISVNKELILNPDSFNSDNITIFCMGSDSPKDWGSLVGKVRYKQDASFIQVVIFGEKYKYENNVIWNIAPRKNVVYRLSENRPFSLGFTEKIGMYRFPIDLMDTDLTDEKVLYELKKRKLPDLSNTIPKVFPIPIGNMNITNFGVGAFGISEVDFGYLFFGKRLYKSVHRDNPHKNSGLQYISVNPNNKNQYACCGTGKDTIIKAPEVAKALVGLLENTELK